MDRLNSITFTPDRERGQHLKFEDRCGIKVFRKMNYSLRRIAEAINCSPSTVMYELRRGTGRRNGDRGRLPEYSAKRGQARYEANRSRCRKAYKLSSGSPFLPWMVRKVREEHWSLDACVGYARKHCLFPKEQIPCTKTLYNGLWAGRLPLTPFEVPEALRRAGRSRRCHAGRRALGRSIGERPRTASDGSEFGHWEIDTVTGKKSGGGPVVLTLVEKLTDYYMAIKIPGKDAQSVMAAMEVLREEFGRERFAKVFRTITADNGSEFASLAELEGWGVGIYFAHPYSSWERPQNERHNRLFRRYIPKGASIGNYSSEQILTFADEMNDLPRKHLGYSAPADLFDAFLDKIYSLSKQYVT